MMHKPTTALNRGAVLAGLLMLSGCGDVVTKTEYPNPQSELVLVSTFTSGGGAAGYTFGDWSLKSGKRWIQDIGSYQHLEFTPKWTGPDRLTLCVKGVRYMLIRQIDIQSDDGTVRTIHIDPGCS
jgi:hypothetical protein